MDHLSSTQEGRPHTQTISTGTPLDRPSLKDKKFTFTTTTPIPTAEMVTRDDGAATVITTLTELKSPTMDWSEEDVYKLLTVLETLPKLWLEIKGVPDHKHYMFILQQLAVFASINAVCSSDT